MREKKNNKKIYIYKRFYFVLEKFEKKKKEMYIKINK